LTDKKLILFICDGNMHRSALGAYWTTQLLQRYGVTDICADSRGVRGLTGPRENGTHGPKDKLEKWDVSAPFFRQFGNDDLYKAMEAHKSRTVSAKDMKRAALILVPDRIVFDILVKKFSKQKSKIELYMRLVGVDAEIANCGGSNDQDLHHMVAEMILRVIDVSFDTIVRRVREG